MACPQFIPSLPLGEIVSGAPPLGELYRGNCALDPEAAIPPEIIRRYCNFGYAKGCCERAAHLDADAARFLVKREYSGVVEVAWSLERNHHPVAVGVIEVAANAAEITQPNPLSRQAQACAAAYLRQTSRSQHP
jgi:hypothetical protein